MEGEAGRHIGDRRMMHLWNGGDLNHGCSIGNDEGKGDDIFSRQNH
jgi:hypothetical protein